MASKFLPHGDYSISLQNRCILLSMRGAFNWEGASDTQKALERMVLDNLHDGLPWAVLVQANDYEMITPDSEPTLIDHYQWCLEHDMRYEAVVGFKHKIQKTQYEKIKVKTNN